MPKIVGQIFLIIWPEVGQKLAKNSGFRHFLARNCKNWPDLARFGQILKNYLANKM